MTILIASISTGKGTWAEVSKIIQIEKWSKVILIGNSFAKDNFKMNQNSEFIEIDPNKSVKEIKNTIIEKLKGKIEDPEVVLNIVSGTGKEHMATISALLSLGLGIRFVNVSPEGIEEL